MCHVSTSRLLGIAELLSQRLRENTVMQYSKGSVFVMKFSGEAAIVSNVMKLTRQNDHSSNILFSLGSPLIWTRGIQEGSRQGRCA